MKWEDSDVRMLAHYMAELNGGFVTLRPRPIMAALWDRISTWWLLR